MYTMFCQNYWNQFVAFKRRQAEIPRIELMLNKILHFTFFYNLIFFKQKLNYYYYYKQHIANTIINNQ